MNIIYQSKRVITLFIIIMLMTGCATMDQSECTMANWYEIGQNDGEMGKKSSHYSRYQKDCGEFGISVDSIAYKDGWETGIGSYCTSDNGYRVGINGSFYQNSCPAEYESQFFSAYQMGRNIHTLQGQANRLRNKLEKAGDDLENVDLTSEQRHSISDKRKYLKKDLELANIRLILAKTEARHHGFTAAF